jgi:hypothetical protein
LSLDRDTVIHRDLPAATSSVRLPVLVGLVFGVLQVASPLAIRWLSVAAVQALLLAAIAAIYIGFAVADGRPRVIVVEGAVAAAFVLIAAVGLVGPAWILAAGYIGHGLKDLWQERRQFVANTHWWPPFCAAVDWLVAGALIVAIVARVDLHS